jgi:hypothetical protein
VRRSGPPPRRNADLVSHADQIRRTRATVGPRRDRNLPGRMVSERIASPNSGSRGRPADVPWTVFFGDPVGIVPMLASCQPTRPQGSQAQAARTLATKPTASAQNDSRYTRYVFLIQ